MRPHWMFFTVTLAGLAGWLMLAAVGHADQMTRGQIERCLCRLPWHGREKSGVDSQHLWQGGGCTGEDAEGIP
jgi:hypothetical protein